MTEIGYNLSSEEHRPNDLVRNAVRAEQMATLRQIAHELLTGTDLATEAAAVEAARQPASRFALRLAAAVLGAGLLNFDGEVIHPPPYVLSEAYEATDGRFEGRFQYLSDRARIPFLSRRLFYPLG